VKKVITKRGNSAMRMRITWLVLLALLTTPFLTACESSKLKEENEGLRKQIESLSREKAQLQSQVKEFTLKGSELTAKVDELTRINEGLTAKVDELSKVNEELKTKLEKKVPTKMKAPPKNK
jgi:peptidoglycan hydrolase CwlO-like protein